MLRTSVKGKYDSSTDKSAASCTFTVSARDLNLRTSLTEATFSSGPSLSGLSLSLEKPGSFILGYDAQRNDFRFVFMNRLNVLDKPVNMTYTHLRGDNRTVLDGSIVFDRFNKLSGNYACNDGSLKVKYSYVHGGVRTIEPSYDFAKNSWDFSVSQKVLEDDLIRASYATEGKVLGLEWSRNSKLSGGFKISAFLNLAQELKMPKVIAESTWNLDM